MNVGELRKELRRYGNDCKVSVELFHPDGGYAAFPVIDIAGVSVMGDGGWLVLHADAWSGGPADTAVVMVHRAIHRNDDFWKNRALEGWELQTIDGKEWLVQDCNCFEPSEEPEIYAALKERERDRKSRA
jgi:hypothetical protein